MIPIRLTKTFEFPMGLEELKEETIEDKHERFLRILILANFTPIYIGDKVKVSSKWAGDTKNPLEGKFGEVINLQAGIQAAFNIDYLIYRIREDDGQEFETYHYALDRTFQPEGNRLLEKLLRETNAEFEDAYKGVPSK